MLWGVQFLPSTSSLPSPSQFSKDASIFRSTDSAGRSPRPTSLPWQLLLEAEVKGICLVTKADGLFYIFVYHMPHANKWPHLTSQALQFLEPWPQETQVAGPFSLGWRWGGEMRILRSRGRSHGTGAGLLCAGSPTARGISALTEGHSDPASRWCHRREKQQLAPQIIVFLPYSLAYSFALSRKAPTPVLLLEGLTAPSSLLHSSHPAQKILVWQSKTGVTRSCLWSFIIINLFSI